MKSKIIFMVAMFFTSYNVFCQNEYISWIRVKVNASSCGQCNDWPIKDVYYGYTNETRIREIITSANYYPYNTWQDIYVTVPVDYRILRWYDPAEGKWVKWIFTPDINQTLTTSYHGTDPGAFYHSTWLDAEVNTYDPIKITNVQCGSETGYIQCVNDINANITFTLNANNLYPFSYNYNLHIKAIDKDGNLISSVYAGGYESTKTFTFSSFNLQNYWGEEVKFVITTGLYSNTLSYTTGNYVFTTPFPDPISTDSIPPLCYGQSNGSYKLTFPSAKISNYVLSYSKLVNGTCDETNSSSFPGYCRVETYSNVLSSENSITLSNLSAGYYEVKVEVNNGTPSCIKTFFIDLPDAPVLYLQDAKPKNSYTNTLYAGPEYQIKGNGEKDEIEINVSGGHPPYRYSINDGTTYSDPTNSVTYLYPGVGAGIYTVRVTDNNNCKASGDKTIPITMSQPDPLTINNIATLPVSCHTGNTGTHNNGSIQFKISGGIGPYDVSLGKESNIVKTNTDNDVLLGGLEASNYKIYVRDNFISNSNTEALVKSNPLLGFNAINDEDIQWPHCIGGADGTLKLSGYGGTPLYTFGLVNGSDIKWDDDDEITDLSAQQYDVIIKDNLGCQAIRNVTIPPNPDPIKLNAIAEPDKHWPHCIGGSDGYLEVSGHGGAPDYAFGLDKGTNIDWAIGNRISDLQALQTYTIVIEDYYGCRDILSNVVIPQNPNPLKAILLDTIRPTCYTFDNGKAVFTGMNGTPYSYGYDFTLKNVISQKVLEENAFTANFIGLAKGIYEISISDYYECEINDYYRDTIILSEPERIIITDSVHQVSRRGLHNGYAEAAFTGGNKKYDYEWYKGLSPLNDSILKSGVTNDKAFIGDLPAGDYLLRVKDTCGCNNGGGQDAWLEWQTHINEPSTALNFKIKEQLNVSCNGMKNGRLIVEGNGGWGNNYRYGLQPGNLTYDNIFNNLEAGLYTVYVADEVNEIFSDTVRITEPGILYTTHELIQPARCYQGKDASFNLNIKGGTQPYYVSIDNNATRIQGTGISDLEAGQYDILITDKNGCTGYTQLNISQPQQLFTTLTSLEATHCGESSGSISVSCSGGTPGYTYMWQDSENIVKGTSASITDLSTGIYRLVLTDANNCIMSSEWYTVANSDGPVLKTSIITPVSCFGYSDGRVQAGIEKGIPPYSYEWSDGQRTETASGLQSKDYFVKVTDSDNCTNTFTFEIPTPQPLTALEQEIKNPQCHNYSDGSVTISGSGGTAPYKYLWNTGFSAGNNAGLKAGSYTATITDSKGCSTQYSVHLADPDPVIIDLGGQATVCGGQTVTLDAGPYKTFNWTSDNGFTSSDKTVSLNKQGNYKLEVTDLHGCKGNDTFKLITSNSLLNADFLIKSEAFTGDTVVAINISWPLPEKTYWSYDTKSIDNISATDYENLIFKKPGTYQITMFATLGDCKDNFTHEIKIKEKGNVKSTRMEEQEALIRKFTIHPNPNKGNFTTEIELREEAEIQLRFIGGARLIDTRKIKGLSNYTIEYNFPYLSPGIYFVQLRAGNEQKELKIIIH